MLENARIIDGTGASAIDRGWIQIERGRIVATGAGDAPTVPNANVADLAGKTVLGRRPRTAEARTIAASDTAELAPYEP